MAEMRGVSELEEELARAKENLKDVDENIKKLTGRDPGESRPGQRRVSAPGGGDGGNFGGRGRLFNAARRSLGEPTGPPAKRRAVGGAFSRLGPRLGARLPGQRRDSGGEEDDPANKPAVQSSVIVTPKDTRTRQDMIKAQNKDQEGKARNRRMFGILLGTLQSFQKDARVEDDKAQQRKAIEEKLEQQAVEERERIRKERQGLFQQRKREQAKLRRLEQKMELVRIHKEWETQTKNLMNFARTKAKPHIYYLPKTHTSATEKKVKETSKILEEIIRDRRKQLEEEIEELTKKDQEVVIKQEEVSEDEEDEDHEGDDGNQANDSRDKMDEEGDKEEQEDSEMDKTMEEKENKVEEEGKENKEKEEKESKESKEKKEHRSRKDSDRESRTRRQSESDRKRERRHSGDRRRERRDSGRDRKPSSRDDKHRDDKHSSRDDKHRSKEDRHSKDDKHSKDVKDKHSREDKHLKDDKQKVNKVDKPKDDKKRDTKDQDYQDKEIESQENTNQEKTEKMDSQTEQQYPETNNGNGEEAMETEDVETSKRTIVVEEDSNAESQDTRTVVSRTDIQQN